MSDPSTALLEEGHLQELEDSAISPQVAQARGYRTITARSHLAHHGFSRTQGGAGPWLVLPMYSAGDKTPTTLQIKPTTPRTGRDGKPVKYESPAGSMPVLDVNPLAQGALSDPTVPLWITEGVKKGDAIVSQGGAAISLTGVWGWKSGSIPSEDWGKIALKERQVLLAFDSDSLTKAPVWDALDALVKFLTKRGAEVSIVQLPILAGTAKTGIDDYLASGQTLDNARQLIAPLPPRPAVEKPGMSYRLDDGDTIDLTNFSLRITKDTLHDDGEKSHRILEVEALLPKGNTVVAEIPANKFDAMDWITPSLGSSAVVYSFPGARDKLREAVLLASDPKHVTEYGHTGWRKIGKDWAYLFPGGAITPAGLDKTPDVKVTAPRADLISLPSPTTDLVPLQRSLDLIDPAVGVMPVRLYMAIWRATLGSTPYAGWVSGLTGTGKSTLASLAQSHWGAGFDGHRFIGNWDATENFLEEIGFLLKDTLLVIDDWRATFNRKYQVMKVDRVVRSQANEGGRGRLTRTLDIRFDRQVRAMILATAEDDPTDEGSLLARLMRVQLADNNNASNERFSRMSPLQGHAANGDFAQAMSQWLHFLSPRLDAVKEKHAERMALHRAGFATGHARMATMAADLYALAEIFLAWCVNRGAMDRTRHDDILLALREELAEEAEIQSEEVHAASQGNVITGALQTLILQGKVRIDGMEETAGLGDWIGWLEGDTIFVLPAAGRLAVAPVIGYTPSAKGFSKGIYDAGVVGGSAYEQDPGDGNRRSIVKKHQGRLLRVIPISRVKLMGGVGEPEREDF